jgi:hypothetical protein
MKRTKQPIDAASLKIATPRPRLLFLFPRQLWEKIVSDSACGAK